MEYVCSALFSQTIESHLGLPPSVLCYFDHIDFLSVSQKDHPCSHIRAFAFDVPSVWNALPIATRKAHSFPLSNFQQKHHLFREPSYWAPTHCF